MIFRLLRHSRRRLRVPLLHGPEHGADLILGVLDSGEQLVRAAELLDQLEAVGRVLLLLVNVGDGTHQRAQNDFGVVLEEVDLEEKRINVGLDVTFLLLLF